MLHGSLRSQLVPASGASLAAQTAEQDGSTPVMRPTSPNSSASSRYFWLDSACREMAGPRKRQTWQKSDLEKSNSGKVLRQVRQKSDLEKVQFSKKPGSAKVGFGKRRFCTKGRFGKSQVASSTTENAYSMKCAPGSPQAGRCTPHAAPPQPTDCTPRRGKEMAK